MLSPATPVRMCPCEGSLCPCVLKPVLTKLARATYDPGCSPANLRKGEHCPISQRWPDLITPSEVGFRPWLALGILTAPSRNRQFRAAFNVMRRREVAWRFVLSAGWSSTGSADPDVVEVPCPDGEDVKQLACFCKTTWWFRLALALFPTSGFIGKVEDDTVVHVSRLILELQWAVRLTGANAMIWYGHFQWAVHRRVELSARPSDSQMRRPRLVARAGISERSGFQGLWCTDGDQLLTAPSPKGCKGGWVNATVAPFASGAIDVRSRSFAAHMNRCRAVWRREWEGASCDGQQVRLWIVSPSCDLYIMASFGGS